jgi:hypothetical protein
MHFGTVVCHVTMFWSMIDHIYDIGLIRPKKSNKTNKS